MLLPPHPTLQENVKTLISYVVENFMTTLETVEYVDTFRKLKLKHDQEKDRQENNPETSTAYVFTLSLLSLSPLSLFLSITCCFPLTPPISKNK